jgi:carotenoid cleavage dioxygenase
VQFSIDAVNAGSGFPYRWDPDYQARVGLLRRDDADGDGNGADGNGRDANQSDTVRWFDIPPCYVFHPLNAYDDGDFVVLDVVRHETVFAVSTNGPDDAPPRLERWTLDTRSGRVHQAVVDDRPQEFPRLDEALVGRPYRYGYTSAADFRSDESALIKHDVASATTTVRPLGRSTGPSEPVFVAREGRTAEDDGWILALSYDAERDASDLLVLHAGDLAGEPAAVVHLPARVPVGFHGNWIADQP